MVEIFKYGCCLPKKSSNETMNSILFPAVSPWMTGTTTVFVLSFLCTVCFSVWALSPTSLLDSLESLCCDKSAKEIKQRSHVLKELLQSEINYVQGLSFVAEHFVQPFLDTAHNTTVEEVFNGWLKCFWPRSVVAA